MEAVVDRICQFYNASFTLLHVVPEDISEESMLEIKETSKRILKKSSSKNELKIVKSNNSIEAISNISADYDLLVIGTPEKDNWQNVLFRTGKDKFAYSSAYSSAYCSAYSVLRLTMKD